MEKLESIHLDLIDSLTLEVYYRRIPYQQEKLEGFLKNQELTNCVPITIERVFLCKVGSNKIDISEIHASGYLDIDMKKLQYDLEHGIL